MRESALHDAPPVGFHCHIAGDDEGALRGCAAEFLLAPGCECELRSGSGELGGAGGSNAFARPCNQDYLAIDAHEWGWASRHNGIMAATLLPLFPLSLVVFPRTRLPLHIFEERYKQMVGDAIRGESEFGIVLAR